LAESYSRRTVFRHGGGASGITAGKGSPSDVERLKPVFEGI
jgi:hypothetical protein